MPGAGHEIHREEPLREVGSRLFEDRADAWINMVTAMLTGVGAALRDSMKLAVGTTSRTHELCASVLLFHNPIKACPVIRVLSLELLEGVPAHRDCLLAI